jgi:putative addiction module component (TIGR02574 family)
METLTPDAIARLSPEERFDLIDKLWDSLGEKDWALTPAQNEELARRLETFETDRAEGVAWEDLRDDLLSLT